MRATSYETYPVTWRWSVVSLLLGFVSSYWFASFLQNEIKKKPPTARSEAADEALAGTYGLGTSVLSTTLLKSNVFGADLISKSLSKGHAGESKTTILEIAQAYAEESSQAARKEMRLRLAFSSAPEVATLAARLIANHDPMIRREGYEIIAGNQSVDAFDKIIAGMRSEHDPAVLSEIALALWPSLRSPDEVNALVTEFYKLVENPSDLVQAAGLEALARWDDSARTKDLVAVALESQDPLIRQSALTVLSQTSFDSDQIRLNVSRISSDSTEQIASRDQAIRILSRLANDPGQYSEFERSQLNVHE